MNLRTALPAILLLALLVPACTTRREYTSYDPSPASASTININTATAEELEQLPRIGPKTAEKIVEYRRENGPFRRVEHLMQVRGISEKRFDQIQDFIRTD